MNKLRLRFEKTGRAIYTSHLDLMHNIQRAFSRAGLELKYSEGFNPHPQISIALPLSVGAASVCEILDFTLTGEAELSALPERLTAVMPEGIRVIEAYVPERKPALIKWLEVEGRLEYDSADIDEMLELLKEFFSMDEIIITKKTKRGVGDTDIKPAVRSIELTAADSGTIKLHAFISAQEPTLNPELLCDALRQLAPKLSPDFAQFTRIETYDAEMKVFR